MKRHDEKRPSGRGKRKNGANDLGDLYKLSGDDYMRDRKMFADKDEDDEDLSPAEGEDKLPALENFVENSAYKNAIIEPLKVKNPVPPRYG